MLDQVDLDFVLLTGTGTGRRQPVLLASFVEVIPALVFARIYPQEERIDRHQCQRRQITGRVHHGDLLLKWGGHHTVQRWRDVVWITFLVEQVVQCYGACSTRHIHRCDGYRRKLVLFDDADPHARVDVGATPRRRLDDELDGPFGLPLCTGRFRY